METQEKLSKIEKLNQNLIDGVYCFLSPEEIDEIMKSRINQFIKRGTKNHKNKWSAGEILMRNAVVYDYICRQGLSRPETSRQLSARWDCSVKTTDRYVRMAMDDLVKDYDGVQNSAREVHLERLNNLLEKTLERNQIDSAIKVLDQIAKVEGLYSPQKQEVSIESTPQINFKFGDGSKENK